MVDMVLEIFPHAQPHRIIVRLYTNEVSIGGKLLWGYFMLYFTLCLTMCRSSPFGRVNDESNFQETADYGTSETRIMC